MESKHIVCQGATCQCNFGKLSDILKVKTQSKYYINDKEAKSKLAVTHKEIGQPFEKNMFGNCSKLNNNPCKVSVTEWSGYYKKITIQQNQGHPLLEDSKATCIIGGKDCIRITNHGQVAELSQQNFKNANPEILNELFPFIDFQNDDVILNIKD